MATKATFSSWGFSASYTQEEAKAAGFRPSHLKKTLSFCPILAQQSLLMAFFPRDPKEMPLYPHTEALENSTAATNQPSSLLHLQCLSLLIRRALGLGCAPQRMPFSVVTPAPLPCKGALAPACHRWRADMKNNRLEHPYTLTINYNCILHQSQEFSP